MSLYQQANNDLKLSAFQSQAHIENQSMALKGSDLNQWKPQTAQQNRQRSQIHTKLNQSPLVVVTSGKCRSEDCSRPVYKQNFCKQHFCQHVKSALKKELRNIFRGPDRAYSSMDFYGRGYITEDDFLKSIVLTRIPFTKEDVKEMFHHMNFFSVKQNAPEGEKTTQTVSNGGASGMTFDLFKRTFFPQLFQINEEQESDEDRKQKKKQMDLSSAKKKQSENIITDRLKKLEKVLKDKFSNNWESVRKAFLALDSDYDGYITVEDILRYFGQENDLDFNDLKKLIKDKDSKKIGKIGYTDFSKWVGNTIHQSEGFYFRHDSIKNPQFDLNNERNELNQRDKSKKLAQESLINQNLEKTVLDKIQFQWKTLRKAFMDLNMEKTGSIMPEELRFYFKHWGLNLTDEQFQYLFQKFDLDGDGKISYKDFQLTVGSEIHPAEGLYFRQDKPQMNKIDSCKHDKCWQLTQGIQNYCSLHQKVHQDQCMSIFEKIFKQIRTKWHKFLEIVKQTADQDDQNQIFLDDFEFVLKRFKVDLTKKESQMLVDAFPGRDEGQRKRVNIVKIYDHKFSQLLQKIYKQVDVHENDGEDDPVDQSGYTGQFYRQKQILKPITEKELVQIISRDNKLVEIIRTIKEIDKQRNGFVTTTELDDILKIKYREELHDRDLKPIMKKYASIQNRVLVDYKKFRDSVIQQLKLMNHNYTFPATATDGTLTPKKTISLDRGNSVFNSAKKINRYEEADKKQQLNNTTVEKNSEDKGLIMISDLIRPQTREYIKYSSTREALIPGQQKKQYLKNGLLNQTMTLQKHQSLLNQSSESKNVYGQISKTPGQKLRLKKMSEQRPSAAAQMFQDSINDYSDFHIKNDNMIDTKLIRENLKRAQSSHGIFGGRNGSTSLQKAQTLNLGSNSNFQGINNLLQSMRKNQRRNITQTGPTLQQQLNEGLPDKQKEENNYVQALSKTVNNNSNQQQQILNNNRNFSLQNSKLKLDYTMNMNDQERKLQNYQSLIYPSKEPQLETSANARINNKFQSTMYQTLNTSTVSSSNNKFREILKQKLSYEWKNLYRILSISEKSGFSGVVSLQDFEHALDQFHVFLSKEELRKLTQTYPGASSNTVNYHKISIDLGLHNNQLNFLKNSSLRMQNIQKLRNIYSSNSKKGLNNSTVSSLLDKLSLAQFNTTTNNNLTITNTLTNAVAQKKKDSNATGGDDQEMTKSEVKDVLLKKLKDFRDLIHIYQRKGHKEEAIIPLGEFKSVLKGLGIRLGNHSLQRFLTQHKEEGGGFKLESGSPQKSRPKSVAGFYGVSGSGIDAREFLKFYL